jgi:hypothetical protein
MMIRIHLDISKRIALLDRFRNRSGRFSNTHG